MKKHILKKAVFLCSAALLVAACSIDDPVAGPTIGGDDPDPGPDPETEILITPDGNFSDWDEIPADKLVSSTVPADAFYATGKKGKVYAGSTYINLYVEFKEDPAMPVQIMHLYIDSDNNQTTGMGNPAWTNDGTDILFEGSLVDEAGENITYDPTIFTYTGEPLAGDWTWEEAVTPGLGVCSNSKFVELDNGNKAFEMTVLRSAVPGLGKVFRMGVALQYDWNDIAYLPAGSAVDNNGTLEHGPVENLLIGGSGGGQTPTPSNARIAIDGDFSDWDALDAKDLFECTAPSDAHYPAARKMKACYNADYLYVYVEYDGSAEAGAGILDFYMDTDAAFDGNGLATTGAGSWIWNNDGTDLFTQGLILGDDGNGYDAPIFQYTGTPLGDEWAWTEVVAAGSGAMSGSQAVTLENGNTAVEVALLRTAIPGLGNEIYIGTLLEKADWSGSCGALPAVSADADGNYVAADKMHIDFRKQNTGDSPEPDPDPEPTEAVIAIDGDLSDWDAVTEQTGYVTTLSDGAFYKGARKMKVAADKNYIFLYVEYDNSAAANVGIMDVWLDTDMAYDGNGLATTGCGSWIWNNDGSEIMIQGSLFDESGNGGWSWADVNMYSGAPLAAEWAWTPVVTGGMGATNSSKAVDLGGGTSAIEAAIVRASLPGLGGKVLLGMMLETKEWGESGVLPQCDADANGAYVAADKLTITLP